MNRRQFLQQSGLGLAALAGVSARARAQEQKRPNIVFILADDLGYTDINAFAHQLTGDPIEAMYNETPHLDRLVQEGTAFSQAYACQLCSPTRASLLTGKIASRVGFTTATPGSVRTWYNSGQAPPHGYIAQDSIYWGDKIDVQQALLNGSTLVGLPAGQPGDQGRDEISLAEALREHQAAFIGKWHVGGHGSKGWQPADQGFEELSYFDAGGSPYFDWRKLWNRRDLVFPEMPQEALLMGKTGKDYGEKYLTDELTKHAGQYIQDKAKQDDPFFLYLCHFSVHTPWQAREDYVEHFTNKATRGWRGHDDPTYAAMVKSLDDSVGAILNTLEEAGIAEETLVVFYSDNGGLAWENFAHSNAPLKGGKAMMYEGGVRVPLVFRWKGHIPEQQWCDTPVDSADMFPTLLDLADYDTAPYYRDAGLDGRSLQPLFTDPQNTNQLYPRDTFYWHYPFNVIIKHPDDKIPLAPHSAIRKNDHKLIYDWSGRVELYNIQEDPYEEHDLSEEQPELTKRLFVELNDWLDTHVDVKYHPALNPDYDPAQEARERPFIDLRKKYLGPERAIRAAENDPRLDMLLHREP